MTTQLLPRANTRSSHGIAPVRGNGAAALHVALFIAGAVLLPLGLAVIGLGWYGVAHTPYAYDQMSYLVSGGILGLGITFCGGFLYFGAWLARIAADQKESAARLSDTLLVLAESVSHAGAGTKPDATPAGRRDPGSILVVAGTGHTVHRADCGLVDGRDDVRPAKPDAAELAPCRLCHPSLA